MKCLALVSVLVLISLGVTVHVELRGAMGELDRAMNVQLNTRRERGKGKH